jgi:hypothetical protein
MTRTRITTEGLTDSSVTTAKIADAAITSLKIADGAIVAADIAASAVTTAKIADGAVTDAKIDTAGLSTSTLNWSAIQSWAANTAYAKGALVEYLGLAYRRSVAGTSGATFVSTNWQQITPTTIPNTMVTGLGTMSTATATDYLAKAGGTMAGQLITTAGNAGAPGVAVGTGTNGLLQPATNAVAISTNGVERLRVASDGAVTAVSAGDATNTLRPTNFIRAWARFSGASTGSPTRTFNVTSITRVVAGSYILNLTTSLSSASGVAVASALETTNAPSLADANQFANAVVATSSTVRVTVVDLGNALIDTVNISVIVCDL